ncbi:hypothetical protein MMYC01_203769 [Madurella mycetomatis]|uniref:Uncharacterized protein n=1 Tax=Madurella mycetomatis TaxID=100816 RepID=A0A175W7X1_9PEZI|nr:hypothetical protein MMYC01_203769 [Madurella mycetomatis]
MDGEITWEGFSPEPRIRDRAVRLNVELTGSRQPSLDDVGTVFEMQSAAQRYAPHNGHENPFRKSPLSPLAGDVSSDMLLCLAGRLRASMFFFEMNSMDIKKGAASFGGSICCRLTPEEKGFTALMNCTQYFTTAGRQYELPKSAKPVAGSARAPFEIPITFCWDPESKDPIRIDVHFGDGKEPHPSRFSISGFPMMVTSLLEYGKMHCDSYVKVGPSRGAAGHSRAKSEKASRISVADRNVTSLDEGVAFEDEKIAALPRYSDVVGNSEMEGY